MYGHVERIMGQEMIEDFHNTFRVHIEDKSLMLKLTKVETV